MKRLKHVINWAIWSILTLYAGLMAFTHIAPCQTWLGRQVAHALSQELNTEVSVGKIDLGFLNRIIVNDVVIKDQQDKEMLNMGRLSVKVELYPMMEGKIVISSAQLFNTHAHLYRENATDRPNFQFVVDALSSKDTLNESTLNVAINSIIIRRSSVSYDEFNEPCTDRLFNPNHLNIKDISAHVLLKFLTMDSLSVNVKRLALKEQSGLTLSRMSFLLNYQKGKARLTDLFLQLPRSSLSIERAEMNVDLDRIKETLNYQDVSVDANITPVDFTFISPEFAAFKTPMTINGVIGGTANSLEVSDFKMVTADGSLSLNASGWMRRWDKTPMWHVRLPNLTATNDFFEKIRHIKDIPEQLCRIGKLSIEGEATVREDGLIVIDGHASSDIGSLRVNGTITDAHHYSGHLETEGIQLGKLMEDEHLGVLSTVIEISATNDHMKATGQVSKFEYNDYTYQNVTIDGFYDPGSMAGKLQIDDPNIIANIEGEITKGKPFTLRLESTISRLKPKSLNLSDQWGDTSFSGEINADFTATTLDDANGTIDIDDFVMRDTAIIYQLDNLHVKSGFDEGVHFLKMKGDMGEAELKGHYTWDTLSKSIMNYVASKLPTLPGLPNDIGKTDNDFNIFLYLKDAEWARHLLGVDLRLIQPLRMEAMVNDRLHKIKVNGKIPQFVFNDSKYENGNITITSPGDTMRCDIAATKCSDGQERMDLSIHAIAANNDLATSLHWDNNQVDKRMKGELHTRTSLYRNNEGKPEAHIYILPSHAMMGQARWNVEPGGIVYHADRLLIDHLAVSHEQQHIFIDGIASSSATDSLIVDLNGVEVAYILDLVNFTAVSFSGQATGKAYVTQAFKKPKAWADLEVEHFEFEGGRMGLLHAHAEWNEADKQIDIQAVADDGPDAKTYIHGYVSPPKDNIDLLINGQGTYIDFLQTYSSSFLSYVTGHATGEVRLIGPLGEMDLLGKLVVDAQAKVTALGTTYTLERDTVELIHNDILLRNVQAKDKYQNTAYLNGGIHHENLSRLTFDLNVKTSQLLAYDIGETTEELFYGTVFTAGEVDMQGRPGEVIINCNVTPLPNSVFTYNAANPDAINDQSFISWTSRDCNSTSSPDAYFPLSAVQKDIPTDLRINFLLNATPDAMLRLLMDPKTNDYITLNGSGVLQATYYNKGPFQMFGTYTVEQGTYGITIQNIIKKNFTFQPNGTIVFGGNPMDANLNLQALYTVNGVSLSDLSIGNSFSNNTVRVNCLMNILGQAGSPQVEFDLDMPTVNSEEKQMIRSVITSEQEMNQQVLYLLGVGRFYTQGANNANTQQQYGQSQLAMQSFLSGTLSTQINEVLSQVLKSNNWNFGANISTGNEGWHNAEYEGVVSGRMLNNRLLINGQFGYRDNATQATPSFIGDFDIRYLLQPNGNLALKMYNQTNDRYFTHSSLNTQGIGLIIKKDFNGLGDLFRHRKKRR